MTLRIARAYGRCNDPATNGLAMPRVLQPCPSCARMLDVSRIAVGERIRCACNHVTSVVAPSPIAVRTFSCRHCGGAFQAGAVACPWCAAGIALEDRNLAGLCGRCFARVSDEARFCPGCGIEVRDQSIKPLAESAACPRCKTAMRMRALEGAEIVECGSCGGLWLTPEQFSAMCAHAEDGGALRRALEAASQPKKPFAEEKVVYLPCATCQQLMMRKNFGGTSGVLIDVCRRHGVWLDTRELERALDFVQRGGLTREKERAARFERERREKGLSAPPGTPPTLMRDPLEGTAADILIEGLFSGLARLAKHMGGR
jgi:Zn-finger nucleic acid-binding protein